MQTTVNTKATGDETTLERRGIAAEDVQLGSLARRFLVFGLALGVAGLLIAGVQGWRKHDNWQGFLHSYLASFTFYLSISLGALFFTILHHLVRAGWSVVVRRIAEALACGVIILFVMSAPILLGVDQIYGWADWHHDASTEVVIPGHGHGPEIGPAHGGHHPATGAKKVWLSPPFFAGRVLFYFAIWIILARAIFYNGSVRQDLVGGTEINHRLQAIGAPAMIVFALTTTFAAFDLLMSIDPYWFSTIFGVYFFAGGVMAFFAAAIIVVYLAQATGKLRNVVTTEHYHDLGKLMFAFTCFWGYIGFSQYMLIWYANMPEETEWWQVRHAGPWGTAGICFLLLGHFMAPFVLIMSRNVKRLHGAIAVAAAWMLCMHWFDHYWMVMPAYTPAGPFQTADLDIWIALGLGGLWLACAGWHLRGVAGVPVRDPRLEESLDFENF